MKTLLCAVTVALTTTVFAENIVEKLTPTKEQWDKMSKEERKVSIETRMGGRLEKPGTRKGKIFYVNAQKRISKEVILANIDQLRKKTGFTIELKDGEFTFPAPRIEGSVSLYIIDDPSMPSLLSAPENRWAMVNIARLSEGDGAKSSYFNARAAKELTRGFCLLAGAQNSNYKNSLLGPITKPEDLDSHADCSLPVDIIQRMNPYLAPFGVTRVVTTFYKRACQEGWAPAPTNEIQRVHWEEAHSIPKKPIKIKYDPKTGK